MREDEGVGDADSPVEGAPRAVADDFIGGARETFVDDFDDDADVGVGFGGGDEGGVDAGDPELGECAVEGGEDEGGEVEEEGAGVAEKVRFFFLSEWAEGRRHRSLLHHGCLVEGLLEISGSAEVILGDAPPS